MKRTKGRIVFEVFNYFFMVFIVVIMSYPFLFILAASLSSSLEVQKGMVGIIPKGFNLEAYKVVLRYKDVWLGYRNTILYTVCGTAVNLIMTVFGAYPLSRKQFVGRGFFTFIVTFTMFFGGGLIPGYLLIRSLGMLNTFWVMIIPGAISTWNMIIMRTFFQSMPEELEEAAIIDGCSDVGVLFRIILPLSMAAIATIGLFYAVGHWNSWFSATIYLRDYDRYPLQVFLRNIVLQNEVQDLKGDQAAEVKEVNKLVTETVKYAVIMVAAVPILCVYPFIQKHFVKGVMIGSIKG